jgi:hypothetical protein
MTSYRARLPTIKELIVDLAAGPTLCSIAVAESFGICLGILFLTAVLVLIFSPVSSSIINSGIFISI